MTQRTIEIAGLNSLFGATPSNVVTAEIPQGEYSIVKVFMVFAGTLTAALTSKFRITADGKDLVPDLSGAEIVALNKFNNYDEVPSTILEWWFGNPRAESYEQERAGELALQSVNGQKRFKSLSLRVEADGTQNAASSGTRFYMVVDDEAKPDLPASPIDGYSSFRAIKVATRNLQNASDNVFLPEMGDESQNFLRAVHIVDSSSYVTYQSWKRDTVPQIEKLAIAGMTANFIAKRRKQQTGYAHYDFTEGGNEIRSAALRRQSGAPSKVELGVTLSTAMTAARVINDVYAANWGAI